MLKVLVLDDDVDNCLTLEHIIRYAGHQVKSTSDSSTFAATVNYWQPYVVVVDLLLGLTDGITVLTEIAHQRYKPEVIVLSGAHHRLLDAASRSASSHGLKVLGTLAKPFSPDTLRQLLSRHLHTPEVQPQLPLYNKPRLTLSDLENGFHLNAFYLVYQPKIECRTTTLTGFEALCRLKLPDIGEVSPDQFILLCEEYGIINRLTQFVISTAIPWYAEFLKTHPNLTSGGANSVKLA